MNGVAPSAAVLLAAFLLDQILGDPGYSLHPARLIGRIIGWTERLLRLTGLTGICGGIWLAVIVMGISVGAYWGLRQLLAALHDWVALLFDMFIVYSCIALRDLLSHAQPIAAALERDDLPEARQAVQKIVGRDAAALDAQGVARAAVESVAEGFLDGVFAPLSWFVFGAGCAFLLHGPPLPWAVTAVLAYRAANTLDSMVGYKNERYLYFGRAGARLDDGLNFVPARLAIPFLCLGSVVCGLQSRAGWRTTLRDRRKHPSPNSGHTESFTAGALGIRLGGPARYPHGTVEKPWLGTGTPDATSRDIRAACRLILCAGWISMLTFVIVLLVLGLF